MIYNFPDHICGDTWKGVSSITIMENNSSVDLSDCDVFIQFRPNKNLASPVFLELSTYSDTIKIVIPEMGLISIPRQIINIPTGEYNYDLQINFPTGKSKTYLKGKINILPEITRTSSNPINIYSPLYDQKLIITGDEERILTSDGERLNYI
jgi:hypothetical protein